MRPPCTVSTHERAFLREFELVSCAAGACATPSDAAPLFASALTVKAPATVAAALAAAKRLELSAPPDLDGTDHWFRTRLPDELTQGTHVLVCDGLATLCDAWVDGQHVLHSENMFRRHEVVLPALRPGA